MKNKIYCCYSVKLRDFLISNGLRYDVVGLNPTSKRMFWGFIKNDKLNIFLSVWSGFKK